MSISQDDLVKGFFNSGIESGSHILVHSSLSSLGWVEGNADCVIDSLIQTCGPDGTVIFPTLTGCPDDSQENPPRFDARYTRCWTGIIPETARKRTNAKRSIHPTHSVVAFGRLADWITSGHELVLTPCGFGSPYDKLANVGGYIVLIGVTLSANTSFHHAEEIAGVKYVVQDKPMDIELIDNEGNKVLMKETRLHRWGPKRDYEAFEPSMIELGICRITKVGEADVRVIDASFQRMFLLRKLLADPLATLDLSERHNWQ